jgi:L-fuculose-phosphate aldolase
MAGQQDFACLTSRVWTIDMNRLDNNDGGPNGDLDNEAVHRQATLREQIVAYGLKLAPSGLSQGTSGNLSVRTHQGFLITPSGRPYDEIAPDDVVQLDMQGCYNNRIAPSSEWRFHRDIYAARPDVHAIVHVHPPYSTALAICRMEIPAIHYMIAVSGGDSIRCCDYYTYGTQELSDAVVRSLEGRMACLMANHGMIAIGANLEQAMWRAVEVETLARQYTLALQVGKPVRLNDREVAQSLEKFGNYGLMSRQVAADGH